MQDQQVRPLEDESIRLRGGPNPQTSRWTRRIIMIALAVGTFLGIVRSALRHGGHINPLVLAILLVFVLAMGGLMMLQLKFMEKHLAKHSKIELVLAPSGLTLTTNIEGELWILWDEIATVQAGRLLGMSVVELVPRDLAALKARLGAKLIAFRLPGGKLGFRADVFGLSADDLAARIERYRERGIR